MVFTFRLNSDESLFTIAYIIILPLKGAGELHRKIFCPVLKMVAGEDISKLCLKALQLMRLFSFLVEQVRNNAAMIKETKQFGIQQINSGFSKYIHKQF
ncbi:hypothetical protein [Mastigocladopsis repens]|uniref:hypothetical protein n=1 Tax=Mastigocladopsis repens TaxID=221287 RepID=UPI00036068D4|nr:hypothetical protein [Mastigocladopsis repens]